jgi:hypothetical protein
VLLGDGEAFMRWDLVGHWMHALKGDCGVLVSSLFSLLLPGHEVSDFALPPALTIGPKATGPINDGLYPQNL